jgi:glycosyltransferase involved in cell wall biosynthesis
LSPASLRPQLFQFVLSSLASRHSLLNIFMPPLVSIIVPSFNQGRFIRATIDSILSQDYRPLQIHVIDGGSRDETVDVLKSYGDIQELRWISEPDKGVVDAVNKGFRQVSGDIVGIQSSDDTYLPGAISQAVATLTNNLDCGLVYGDTVKIDAAGKEISRNQIGPFSIENFFLFRTWIPQPSAFFRRQMLDVCGGWDDRVPYAADTDLWMRIMFKAKVIKQDAFWSQRRIHDAQRDTQVARISRDFCRMIDQSADIASASPDVRRQAQVAKHLIQIRYNGTNSDWHAAWHLWQAGRILPSCRNWSGVLSHLMLPARRFGSKVKQTLRLGQWSQRSFNGEPQA